MTQSLSRKRPASDTEDAIDSVGAKKLKAASGLPVIQVNSTVPTTSAAAPAPAPASTAGPQDAQPDQQASEASGSVGMNVEEVQETPTNTVESEKKKGKRRADAVDHEEEVKLAVKYRKLKPQRPYPTVPTSVSATGPRSAHVEGKNYICITRKTPLGMYLRRCKDVVLKDGHKTLHLSAMGAAIPHLLQLTLSLPDILPYPADEIKTEVQTGTVEVEDEVIPDDEDEDMSIRKRGKSTLSVVITIGDGVDEGPRSGKGRKKASKPGDVGGGRAKNNGGPRGKGAAAGGQGKKAGSSSAGKIVVREEDMDEA